MEGLNYDVKDAAKELHVGEGAIRNWIKIRKLGAFRLNPGVKGSPLRIPVSEVQRIIDERQAQLEGRKEI